MSLKAPLRSPTRGYIFTYEEGSHPSGEKRHSLPAPAPKPTPWVPCCLPVLKDPAAGTSLFRLRFLQVHCRASLLLSKDFFAMLRLPDIACALLPLGGLGCQVEARIWVTIITLFGSTRPTMNSIWSQELYKNNTTPSHLAVSWMFYE